MIKSYQYGNTIRLECVFYDLDNNKVDPNLVRVIIYDGNHKKIHESNGSKRSIGEYYYDYTTEEKRGRYIYEWYGEMGGKPILRRGEFITKFV